MKALTVMKEMTPKELSEVNKFLKKRGMQPVDVARRRRRALAIQHCKERLQHDPFYAKWTDRDWQNYQGSAALVG